MAVYILLRSAVLFSHIRCVQLIAGALNTPYITKTMPISNRILGLGS